MTPKDTPASKDERGKTLYLFWCKKCRQLLYRRSLDIDYTCPVCKNKIILAKDKEKEEGAY